MHRRAIVRVKILGYVLKKMGDMNIYNCFFAINVLDAVSCYPRMQRESLFLSLRALRYAFLPSSS